MFPFKTDEIMQKKHDIMQKKYIILTYRSRTICRCNQRDAGRIVFLSEVLSELDFSLPGCHCSFQMSGIVVARHTTRIKMRGDS